MADSPKSEASHDSAAATGKIHASKDKQCQYCHQNFTSSSLGRHLDQFIFRKKPDGIHNVEDIRRQRGGITRRIARGSSNAKQDRGKVSHLTPGTTSPVNRNSPAADSRVDLNATPVEGYRMWLNAPTWQSTGVINGLPGTNTASPGLENDTSAAGKRSHFSIETAVVKDTISLRADLGTEKDTARALELALREVLDTIQAAHAQTIPDPSPFPIDVQSHNFPSLVLHLLPPPPTLLTSPTPFATPDSFPISSPPDHTHLDLLRSTIASLVTTWRSNRLSSALPQKYPDKTTHSSHINSAASAHTVAASEHLDLAYKRYTCLPEHVQQEIWQIELARAFASEMQKSKELQGNLEAVMAEARRLSGQVECLSRCQWPREMALWPPDKKPIRSSVIKAMESRAVTGAKRRKLNGHRGAAEIDGRYHAEDSDSDDNSWDYDILVEKWKNIIRQDAARKRGLKLPVPYTATPVINTNRENTITNHDYSTSSSTPAMSTGPARPPPPPSRPKDDHFEPWSKKPRVLLDGGDCKMGFPGSGQQQHQSQRHSNLKDLITDSHFPAPAAPQKINPASTRSWEDHRAYGNGAGNPDQGQTTTTSCGNASGDGILNGNT